jgi:hypothetical protein
MMGVGDRWNNIFLVNPELQAETSFKGLLRNNLLSCQGGCALPAEICLKIIEKVVDNDPKSVKTLMGISRVCPLSLQFTILHCLRQSAL